MLRDRQWLVGVKGEVEQQKLVELLRDLLLLDRRICDRDRDISELVLSQLVALAKFSCYMLLNMAVKTWLCGGL